MKEAKLLNCPFCKEELEVVGKGHYFAHKTNGCILQPLCFEIDDEEAIKAFNTRKPMERILERLEGLKGKDFISYEDYEGNVEFHFYGHTSEHDEMIRFAIEIVKEEGGIE